MFSSALRSPVIHSEAIMAQKRKSRGVLSVGFFPSLSVELLIEAITGACWSASTPLASFGVESGEVVLRPEVSSMMARAEGL